MKLKLNRAALAAATCLAAVAAAQPASALTFTLVDTGGAAVGTQARAGFEAAAFYWSSVFADNVDVTIDIGFQSLGGNILGQTGSSSAVALTSDVYSALAADKTTLLDNAAVNNLKALTTVASGSFAGFQQLAMKVNRTTTVSTNQLSDRNTRIDNDGTVNNIALSVNTANMKALGFTEDANGDPFDTPDGAITFSSDFDFDFDPTDGITAGFSDFIGVAIHEIGHALGFVSGVDIYDYYTFDKAAGNATKKSFLDNYAIGSTLDLFRYDAAGEIDWSTSATDKYFSLNGGVSALGGNASFATGVYNGDGDQASHWKAPTASPFCTGFVGIMNPYLCDGTGAIVTAKDLAAMDAIGWDSKVNLAANPTYMATTASIYTAYQATLPPVPEPATWLQMIAGMGALGGALRLSRRAVRRVVIAA